MHARLRFTPLLLLIFTSTLPAAERALEAKFRHLRNAEPREWADFPEKAEATHLELVFDAKRNIGEQTLELRQQDLKQTWSVLLNSKSIGRLYRDENDMRVYFPLPNGTLKDGRNVLRVETKSTKPDDVRVGEVVLHDRSMKEVLSVATVQVTVRDAGRRSTLPSRITIVDEHGTLATTSATSNDHLAVRPGVVFTSTGRATFGLPAGTYTIYAGRGFEYGVDSTTVTLKPGDVVMKTLAIEREVPTSGYVSCDTHVHTLTHSGHGDASIEERMVTLAAEAIELPIATDHNKHIDYEELAKKAKVRRYFTPVIGNEVTTKIGHFNVFPTRADAPVPDFRLDNWKAIFDSIYGTPEVKVAILNHARDVHSGVTPFGPKLHNGVTGENLEGWVLRANAMELINSGAQQTDMMQLYHDWFGLLNRGLSITPVGSSDSHDVSRHFVGQGRTYIKCDDGDVSKIDVDAAVANFVAGRVNVSCGLLCTIGIEDRFGPGDLAPKAQSVEVSVQVLGPSWTKANVVELYANGRLIEEVEFADDGRAGVKWSGEFTFENPGHDVHLVAVARGPGVLKPFWPVAKPYQATSPVWKPTFLGSTGTLWIDGDGDGKKTPAYAYAKRIVADSKSDLSKIATALKRYDSAVASQVASLLDKQDIDAGSKDVRAAFRSAGKLADAGLLAYLEARRASMIARSSQ